MQMPTHGSLSPVPSKIALASVLPKKVAEFENETANRRDPKRSDEEDYIGMCQHIREQKPKWDIGTKYSNAKAKPKDRSDART
jgi:hypothetical protein